VLFAVRLPKKMLVVIAPAKMLASAPTLSPTAVRCDAMRWSTNISSATHCDVQVPVTLTMRIQTLSPTLATTVVTLYHTPHVVPTHLPIDQSTYPPPSQVRCESHAAWLLHACSPSRATDCRKRMKGLYYVVES
jgi:hypothetical protein